MRPSTSKGSAQFVKDWADKAAALGSYARQSKDESLFKLATRIQARAIRRCGELLKEFESATGAHLKSTGNHTLSRKQAAKEAGLSKNQKDTAIRVATVPEEEFEAQVESDSPPTVTALAEQGTQKKPLHDLEGIDPNLFKLVVGHRPSLTGNSTGKLTGKAWRACAVGRAFPQGSF